MANESRAKIVEKVASTIMAEEASCPDGVHFYGMVIGHAKSVEISVNGHNVEDLLLLSRALSDASSYVISLVQAQLDGDVLDGEIKRRVGELLVVPGEE